METETLVAREEREAATLPGDWSSFIPGFYEVSFLS